MGKFGVILLALSMFAWADDDRNLNLTGVVNGRLTLTSGTPITTSDLSAQSAIFFTPYAGNKISIYDGAQWKLYNFSEISIGLSALTSGKNYDVFIYSNSGTPALELSAAWSGDNTRTDNLTLQDGVYVKSGTTTRRYLGTFRTTSTTTTEDSVTKRFLWNYYNRTRKRLFKSVGTASWSYNTASWRAMNGSASNVVEVVTGLAESALSLIISELIYCSGNTVVGAAIGEDITTNNASSPALSAANTTYTKQTSTLNTYPTTGYHAYYMIEHGSVTGSNIFHGSSYSAMDGDFEC